MSDQITFFAIGIPKGQPRIRAFVRGKHAGVYTPPQADDWKACVMIAGKQHLKGFNVGSSPAYVRLEFVFPRPKSHFKTNGDIKDSACGWQTSKPDADNLQKLVLDVMTQLGVWNDDCQVCLSEVKKRYASSKEKSGCLITITPLT